MLCSDEDFLEKKEKLVICGHLSNGCNNLSATANFFLADISYLTDFCLNLSTTDTSL